MIILSINNFDHFLSQHRNTIKRNLWGFFYFAEDFLFGTLENLICLELS